MFTFRIEWQWSMVQARENCIILSSQSFARIGKYEKLFWQIISFKFQHHSCSAIVKDLKNQHILVELWALALLGKTVTGPWMREFYAAGKTNLSMVNIVKGFQVDVYADKVFIWEMWQQLHFAVFHQRFFQFTNFQKFSITFIFFLC